MNKDKFKVYLLEFGLLVILFFTLLISNVFTKITLSVLLLVYTIVTISFLKKRNILSIHNNKVTLLFLLLALIYLGLFYLSGFYFGFSEASVKFSIWTTFNYIIPYIVIIVTSEILRYIFLSQKVKISKYVAFISMILLDLIIYSQIYDITNLDGFLTILGFIFFASISCNMLYNYVSCRFGYKPVVVYRLITVLYIFLIPVVPDMFIFFRSVLRMLYPYIVYLLLEYSFVRTVKLASARKKFSQALGTIILIILVIGITMIVSCKFKYGVLVIGSGSMADEISIGDCVVFESYKKQAINKDMIIVFKRDDKKIVHRVIRKSIANNKYRYYTKGDANKVTDSGYVTDKEIIGIVKFKIPCIGYPSLWIREVFSK